MEDAAVFEIVVPKENASDDTVTVVECLFENGGHVQEGDCVSVCENSKTAFDITTDKAGYIFYLYKPEECVAVGAPLAIISTSTDFSLKDYLAKTSEHTESEDTDKREAAVVDTSIAEEHMNFSSRALALIKESGLLPSQFAGQGFVTESDVIAAINKSSVDFAMNECLSETSMHSFADIVIFGGGGHARMCIDLLQAMGGYRIVGIVDSDLPLNSLVLGIPVIGREADFSAIYASGVRHAVLGIGAVGKHSIREKLFSKLKSIGFLLPNLIHPKAAVERSVLMGEGNQVMANATVGSCVRLGNNCIINSGAIVSHDSALEDNVHVSPGAALAGGVSVGANSLVGMNATIYMKVRIGYGVTVSNGINVLVDIESSNVVR